MRTGRKEVSFVAAGKAVRINITINHDGLTREELARATNNLADQSMLAIQGSPFFHANLSKIKVR